MKNTAFKTFLASTFVTVSACGLDVSGSHNTGSTTPTSVNSTTSGGTTGSSGNTGSSTTQTGSTTGATPTPGVSVTPSSIPSTSPTLGVSPTPTPTAAALDPDTCTVVPANELMVTQVSVVEDAVRTTWAGSTVTDAQDGAWAIGRVLTRLSGAADAGPYVNSVLNALTADDSFMASNWPKSGTAYTLTGTPMVLDAIVNRIDLRNPAASSLGELRFIFGTNIAGQNLDGKMIVEIVVAPSAQFTQLSWAQAWHKLSDPNLTSAQYNSALQVLTDYALDNAQSHYRIRTANETPLQDWTFRQFEPQSGVMVPANLSQTPARQYDLISLDDPNSYFGPTAQIQASQVINPNDRAVLLSFVESIAGDVADGNYSVPASMGAPSFQMLSAYRSDQNKVGSDESWSIPTVSGITSETFSVNTCNGCHGVPLVLGNNPAQVSHRVKGLPSSLSDFLEGTSDGKYNDLQRRANDMSTILCGNGATVAGVPVVIPNN